MQVARPLIALLTFVAGGACAFAQTSWLRWSNNGHYYLAVHKPAGIDWADARLEAQALGGDLATITSQAENDFVFTQLADDPLLWRTLPNPLRSFGPWLGGFQPPGAPAPAAGWLWVSGEPWGYTSWSPNEPNDYLGQLVEDRLHYFTDGATTPSRKWNDLEGAVLVNGFIVESTTPGPVPYCTAGTSSSGCVPSISASAQPSASYSTACLIQVHQVEGQRQGIVFYGVSGAIAVPWQSSNSYRCVASPVQRTGLQSTGGTNNACDGVLVLAWNAYQQQHPAALGQPWTAGEAVSVQAWYRDPGAPVTTTAMSNALALMLQP